MEYICTPQASFWRILCQGDELRVLKSTLIQPFDLSRPVKISLTRPERYAIFPIGKIIGGNWPMPTKFTRSGQKQPDSESARIGVVIRQARIAHGLTQTQLAGLAGTGLRFVSELERGKPNVSLDKTLAVLAVLGLRLQITGAGS